MKRLFCLDGVWHLPYLGVTRGITQVRTLSALHGRYATGDLVAAFSVRLGQTEHFFRIESIAKTRRHCIFLAGLMCTSSS